MAKKGKKKKDDSAKRNKAEIRAYYEKHGWKETVSHFKIAPKDLSPIVKGKKSASKKAAAPKKKKAPKKTPKKGAPKAKATKKKGKKGKSAEAPYGYKKDGTPKKPPGRKAGKKATKKASAAAPKKKAPKKRSKKKATKRKVSTRAESSPVWSGKGKGKETREIVLDWLLDYRKKNQPKGHMVPLDSVIIDLTASLRKT